MTLTVTTKLIVVDQTSGLTVATRLSEDTSGSSVSVLVIEAGPANLDDPDICSMSATFDVSFLI